MPVIVLFLDWREPAHYIESARSSEVLLVVLKFTYIGSVGLELSA